jgi:hypothetical protein
LPNSGDLILRELILRRQEAHSALANLYLRGTVLLAVAVTETGIIANLRLSAWIAISLHSLLIVASLMGLVSFWLKKTQKFKVEFMDSFLERQGHNAAKSYREYIQSDYEKIEKAVTVRTRSVKFGFALRLAILVLIAVISSGQVA